MKSYISNLRIISTIAVIILHTSAPFLYKIDTLPKTSWQLANFIDSAVRFSVPVFVMISGSLLLKNKDTLTDFLTKRYQRILKPLVFWSVIYLIFEFIYGRILFTDEAFYIFKRIVGLLFTGVSYHFWYIYMIIGLYLIIPILKPWIQTASKKEIEYFLVIWAFTIFSNTHYIKYFFPNIFLLYFSQYIGYLVAGYYLDHFLSVTTKTKRIGFAFFSIGTILTILLTNYLSTPTYFNEAFYGYSTPNVALAAIGVFILSKCYLNKTTPTLQKIDLNTFGIYFIHILILNYLENTFPYNQTTNILLYILLLSFATFLISYLLIQLLSKIPKFSNYIK